MTSTLHLRISKMRLGAASAALMLAITLAPAALAAPPSQPKGLKGYRETVLYAFKGGTDGQGPNALFMDTAGNFYGTTSGGGTAGYGTVFKLDTSGAESVLYSFSGGTDGNSPSAGLVMDRAGNLYGSTVYGGAYGYGVLFKLDTNGTETVLHSFAGGTDGSTPLAAMILDGSGNLYGTACGDCGYSQTYSDGLVFKVDSSGTETILWNMNWPDPAFPFGGVVMDSKGILYGTTSQGGGGTNGGHGVVFKLNPTSGVHTVLYKFKGYPDGDYSEAGVILDSAGNLYGTTESGGSHCSPYGCGTVFKVTETGKETVLHSFDETGKDGYQPTAGVVRDKAGNLYGTTPTGDAIGCNGLGCGTVFKLDTKKRETVLYKFKGGKDGAYPWTGLIMGNDGKLYGTTGQGGGSSACSGGCGTVWKLTP